MVTTERRTVSVTLCTWCQPDVVLTSEERLDHTVSLVNDIALVEALKMIHGEYWFARYIEVGGILHLSEAEVRNTMAESHPGIPIITEGGEEE